MTTPQIHRHLPLDMSSGSTPPHSTSTPSPLPQASQAGGSARQACKCSQCDPSFYSIPVQMLYKGNVEYVCRDCHMSTLSYQAVQMHESTSGHRRWYNYPQ
ncbi:hypothetical protein EC988_005302 [Linderina pennispora]|nr:hypothetical protein EC988_005302 [Linderina pennispora]